MSKRSTPSSFSEKPKKKRPKAPRRSRKKVRPSQGVSSRRYVALKPFKPTKADRVSCVANSLNGRCNKTRAFYQTFCSGNLNVQTFTNATLKSLMKKLVSRDAFSVSAVVLGHLTNEELIASMVALKVPDAKILSAFRPSAGVLDRDESLDDHLELMCLEEIRNTTSVLKYNQYLVQDHMDLLVHHALDKKVLKLIVDQDGPWWSVFLESFAESFNRVLNHRMLPRQNLQRTLSVCCQLSLPLTAYVQVLITSISTDLPCFPMRGKCGHWAVFATGVVSGVRKSRVSLSDLVFPNSPLLALETPAETIEFAANANLEMLSASKLKSPKEILLDEKALLVLPSNFRLVVAAELLLPVWPVAVISLLVEYM